MVKIYDFIISGELGALPTYLAPFGSLCMKIFLGHWDVVEFKFLQEKMQTY